MKNYIIYGIIFLVIKMIIDTHCHLSKSDYENLDEVIKNMNGIMIVSGCDTETNKEVIELVNKYKNVYGTLGIHPEEVTKITKEDLEFIEKHINDEKIVAVGEIGLDYYWVDDNKEEQKKLFIEQLEIAKRNNKPIVVHSRDSIQDVYDILKQYNLRGDIHCFSSSIEMAKQFINIGYYIGVGGVVTFKNSNKLKEVVKDLPIDKVLIETDSPYLTPEPYRGKRNEPKYVMHVAEEISKLKQIDISDVIDITYRNANNLFDLGK